MICRNGSVGATGQNAPTNGYEPPLKIDSVVVNRFLLNDDMVVFGFWRNAMSIIIIYMYIYTHEESLCTLWICKSNYIVYYIRYLYSMDMQIQLYCLVLIYFGYGVMWRSKYGVN